MGWLLLGGVKSITNSRLSLSILKKWQRDMIQCPLLFTIGSSYDWIHLRVTGMKARLVTSDNTMKAYNSLYWSEKDLQKFVVKFFLTSDDTSKKQPAHYPYRIVILKEIMSKLTILKDKHFPYLEMHTGPWTPPTSSPIIPYFFSIFSLF